MVLDQKLEDSGYLIAGKDPRHQQALGAGL